MNTTNVAPVGEIGPWGKIKGEILQKYAHAYMVIMDKQSWCKGVIYVDAFAGLPTNKVRGTSEMVPGSASLALAIEPRFTEYHFIDTNAIRAKTLIDLANGRSDVTVYEQDGNRVLFDTIVPRLAYREYRRALVVLDPYGLQLDWNAVSALGGTRSAEIVINFPTMDINRNALRRDPKKNLETSTRRMTTWWGDDSWLELAYTPSPQLALWGDQVTIKSVGNDEYVNEYCKRLRDVAGFGYVADPFPVKNSTNATLYYLVFASPNNTGAKIMNDILAKYRKE